MIHLIIGSTGAGKSTYAKRLAEKDGAIIFSIDEWNNTLYLMDKGENDGIDWMLERIERSENMIWSLCVQLDMQSQEVILDLGFSKFDHREKFRILADDFNIDYKLHFLDFPKDVRLDRVLNRNTVKGDTYIFDVNKDMFDFMETRFEMPSKTELKGAIVINDDSYLAEEEFPKYFDGLSRRNHMKLRFCLRLSKGIEHNTSLNILRNYVIDFWDNILSEHIELGDTVFAVLDKSNEKVIQYFEENREITNMINAIKNSESVSNSYLEQLIEMLKAHIRFEERSFFSFVIENHDDNTLKSIQEKSKIVPHIKHDFSPDFWEK